LTVSQTQEAKELKSKGISICTEKLTYTQKVLIHQLLCKAKFGNARNNNHPDAKDDGWKFPCHSKKNPFICNPLFAICEVNEGQFHA